MNREDIARPRRLLALGSLLLILSAASAAAALPDGGTASSPVTPTTETDIPSDQPIWPAGSDTWLVFRTGIREGAAFRTVATIVEEGRWIKADLGYSDAGNPGEYRSFWIGAGGMAVDKPGLRLELKAGLSKSFGTASPSEHHFLSNVYLAARPRESWKLEISHTEALALNQAAVWQSGLDRARLEYEVGDYQLGVGYAGAQSGGGSWQHRPFVSVSRAVRGFGEIELWLQRVERSDGPTERLQVRFTRKLTP